MQPFFCRPSPISSSILSPLQEMEEMFWVERPQNVQILFDTRRIVQLLPKPKQSSTTQQVQAQQAQQFATSSSSTTKKEYSDFEKETTTSLQQLIGKSLASFQTIEDFFSKLSVAFSQRLIPSEQDAICNYLASQPEKIAQQLEENYFEKLTPNQFSSLAVNNDKIATELLVSLQASNSKSFMLEQFTSILFDMPATIHSFNIINNFLLKVFNKKKNPLLDSEKKIYEDKLAIFLKKSMDSLNYERDASQLRVRVRLLCCFIQSLLRKKLLDAESWAPELQNLALSYPDIREAIDLLKLISTKKQAF